MKGKKLTALVIAASMTLCANFTCAVSFAAGADTGMVYNNGKAIIDASGAGTGSIKVKFTDGAGKKKAVRISTPSGKIYDYFMSGTYDDYESFPLSEGNGSYSVTACINKSGNSYITAFSKKVDVTLDSEFAPFLQSSQYVKYSTAVNTVRTAQELVKENKNDLEKIQNIYKYVIGNMTYDKQKAASVKSGYIPDLDSVLAEKKGICFDYAALMTGMLRSQGIPTKLVIGYTGGAYHAWINTYTSETGWVNGAIYFDGTIWKLMDPTFASTAKQSKAIMQYIGDGKNYSPKYQY